MWFTDYAKVTLCFGPEVEGDAAPVLYREILEYGTGNASLVSALPGEVVHLTLAMDKEYELLTVNTCDDTVTLVRFSTRMEHYDVIPVSEEISEAVMAKNKNYENRDIYALMSDLNEIEVHERVAFLQQFLRAEPLSPLYDGLLPPRSAFVPTGGRLLKEGVGIGNEVLLHQFASTVSSGVYLVGTQDKQAFHTYKVFVP